MCVFSPRWPRPPTHGSREAMRIRDARGANGGGEHGERVCGARGAPGKGYLLAAFRGAKRAGLRRPGN